MTRLIQLLLVFVMVLLLGTLPLLVRFLSRDAILAGDMAAIAATLFLFIASAALLLPVFARRTYRELWLLLMLAGALLGYVVSQLLAVSGYPPIQWTMGLLVTAVVYAFGTLWFMSRALAQGAKVDQSLDEKQQHLLSLSHTVDDLQAALEAGQDELAQLHAQIAALDPLADHRKRLQRIAAATAAKSRALSAVDWPNHEKQDAVLARLDAITATVLQISAEADPSPQLGATIADLETRLFVLHNEIPWDAITARYQRQIAAEVNAR